MASASQETLLLNLRRCAVFDENIERQQDPSFLRVVRNGSDGGDYSLRLSQVTSSVIDARIPNFECFEDEVVYGGDCSFGVFFQIVESRVRFFRQMILNKADEKNVLQSFHHASILPDLPSSPPNLPQSPPNSSSSSANLTIIKLQHHHQTSFIAIVQIKVIITLRPSMITIITITPATITIQPFIIPSVLVSSQ